MQLNIGNIFVILILAIGVYFIDQSLSEIPLLSKTQNQHSKIASQILEEPESEPKIKVEEELYIVKGSTRNQLRKNVFSVSPIQGNGKTYVHSIKWWVNWHFFHKETRKGCTITSIESEVIIRKILPNWIDHHRAARPLREGWDTYIRATQEYMEKQGEFGIRAAQEIHQAIPDLEPRESCSELENEAHTLGQNISKHYGDLTQEYRRKTEFGKSLGMAFP